MRAPKSEYPQPGPDEIALQKAQAALLNDQRGIFQQQQQYQRMMLPILAKQAGFDIVLDENGNIKSIKQITDPLDAQRKRIEGLELQRSEDALKGNLPVDPTLERELGSQEQKLRDRLRSQFGAGYETSTPGIQTLDEFGRSAEGLRSDARHAQLTLAEQLSLARQGMGLGQQGQNLNILGGATTGSLAGLFGMAGQNAQGYGQAQIPFLQNRGMQMQNNQFNANMSLQNMMGWGELAGTMFGAAMGRF